MWSTNEQLVFLRKGNGLVPCNTCITCYLSELLSNTISVIFECANPNVKDTVNYLNLRYWNSKFCPLRNMESVAHPAI